MSENARKKTLARLPGQAGGGTRCPHCNAQVKIRDSEQLSPTVRELRMQCQDLECGATYVGSLTIDRMIAPSQKANPRIYLPRGAGPARIANDDQTAAAAH